MAIQDELAKIAENGEILSGMGESVPPKDKAAEAIIDKAVTEAVRRTTLIVADMVAFYFSLYFIVTTFVQDHPEIKKYKSEFVERITQEAGKDPSITYDILVERVGIEIIEKHKGE